MKRRLFLLAACPLPALADTIAQVQQRLVSTPVQRGGFQQDKQLAGFAKPLKSQGDYLLVRGKGLIWRTTAPFASQLVLTRDRIAGGGGLQLDASKEPGIRVVTQLMLSLLDGDLGALQQAFEVQASLGGDKAWRAALRPKAAALAQLFSRIELEGDRQLRRIVMTEAQGDTTTLRFDEQAREPAAPSADEAKQLG
ncbi:outer membrane lipoprotein carrier protein LolA [Pelomonas sp. Root1237]|uniref:LolA family protein n=1 Tax=Pelomonas sp. Root1237 TaxID=1736434 RepID=UPI0009E69B82|nr:outer membrane lipoprotein carrier protein LolA [Pelomonas sp. Root1237]